MTTTTSVEIEGPLIEHSKDLASFRIVLSYHIQTDSIICRFDTKMLDLQFGAMLHAQETKQKPGEIFRRLDPLLAPKAGVIAATAIHADRLTLIKTLRGLADNLEHSE